jgi:hypothetical protein
VFPYTSDQVLPYTSDKTLSFWYKTLSINLSYTQKYSMKRFRTTNLKEPFSQVMEC